MWLSKKIFEKLETNLCKTYDGITGILRKRKISVREIICQRLLLVEDFELNKWQPEWWFPENAFENDIIFLRKS